MPIMKRYVAIAAGVSAVLIVAAVSAVLIARHSLTTPAGAHHGASEYAELLFEIRPGESLHTVSANLAEVGLVRRPRILELYARREGYATRLQAGRYLLAFDMAPVEILRKIVDGEAVFDEIVVTIPEGWSLDDIERYFEALGLFSIERFQEAVVMHERYRDFVHLAPLADGTILDGYLFPDTYHIFADSTPEGIVRRMLDNFHRRVPEELITEIDRQGRTLHDLLALASIVQKESASVDEMPEVAGVFWNRLRINMRLESDATVNYVLGTSNLQPTFADTEVQHPYNTYENLGLPPGPIGNPGLPAIRAALHPAEHSYLFFLHKPNREIVLSRTFAEHLTNKARYLD